jgi:hypothetical protein
MKKSLVLTVLIVLIAFNVGLASDWPQYLGPGRDAVSTETGLKRSWPASGPRVLWILPLGEGFGGPAVSDGKVYVLDRKDSKQNVLRCINLADGKEEWTFAYVAPGKFDQNGSRSVPTIDGNNIYICSPIGKDDHLAMISTKGAVVGIDLKTGNQIWSYDGWQCAIPIPNVTEIGDGRIFIIGGYEAGSAMIKVEKTGNKFAVRELYKTKEFGTHVHPAIHYKGHLYGHCSTNETRDGMVCMDLDGKIKWKTKRSPLFDKGGFILVDGMILSVDGNKGFLYLIEPVPTGFKKLASAKLLDTKRCWAPLALSDGKLLIRDQEQMKCVLVR